MEFNGLTSASHMSLSEAGYGSEESQLGSEISGAVSGVTTPGASRLQASQLQERSATMQRLHLLAFLEGFSLCSRLIFEFQPICLTLHFGLDPDSKSLILSNHCEVS